MPEFRSSNTAPRALLCFVVPDAIACSRLHVEHVVFAIYHCAKCNPEVVAQ